MTIAQDEGIVHSGEAAFRIRVLSERDRPVLAFEHLEWPSLKVRSQLTFPYPNAGYGGAQLSISPACTYAAALLYSGQSEVGYELFTLTPAIRHCGGLSYVNGESDLTPPAFSPDEQLVAIAVEHPFWWIDSEEADPDWDTPAIGGLVEWATVYLQDVRERSPSRFSLRVDLPRGWYPAEGAGTWPALLRFAGKTSLTVGVPWAADSTFEIPAAGGYVVVPPPER